MQILTNKRNIRLSRFSQNINKDLLKSFELSFKKEFQSEKQNNVSVNLIESQANSKRSIFMDQKRGSKNIKLNQDNIIQHTDQTQPFANQEVKNKKYFQPQIIKKYKQILFELPNLHEKSKKQKSKHIHTDFIRFLFQIMKKQDFITKVLDSYVPHQSITAQFINILYGFQIITYKKNQTIEVNKNQQAFLIMVEGAAEKTIVKQTSRLSRKSIVQNSSQTSIFRRSKVKNKTVSQKGKITCFEFNLPIFFNDTDSMACTLNILGQCKFLFIQKSVWNKFLISLQKLEEKYLLNFIKHCTTINLNIYTQKEGVNEKKSPQIRKKFLYDLKNKKQEQSDQQSQQIDSVKVGTIKKATLYGTNLSNSYQLINMPKEEKINVNNQDVYLIVKGSVFLNTQYYSMFINQGSIINSSILLKIQYDYQTWLTRQACLVSDFFEVSIFICPLAYLRVSPALYFLDQLRLLIMRFKQKPSLIHQWLS